MHARTLRRLQAVRIAGAAAAGVMLAVVAAAAATDDATALSAKVDQAISSAASYRVSVTGPDGLALDIVSVGRDRVRVHSTVAGATSESVVIGTAMYYHGGSSAWAASAVPAVKTTRKNLLYMAAPGTKLEPLPDRSDGGVTYGAFGSLGLGNAGTPATMECTYDKTTYRPHTCTIVVQSLAEPLHVTYDKWNDPSNDVEAPPGVAPPTPAPAAAPSRAPH
jgi:hypothetical protein